MRRGDDVAGALRQLPVERRFKAFEASIGGLIAEDETSGIGEEGGNAGFDFSPRLGADGFARMLGKAVVDRHGKSEMHGDCLCSFDGLGLRAAGDLRELEFA